MWGVKFHRVRVPSSSPADITENFAIQIPGYLATDSTSLGGVGQAVDPVEAVARKDHFIGERLLLHRLSKCLYSRPSVLQSRPSTAPVNAMRNNLLKQNKTGVERSCEAIRCRRRLDSSVIMFRKRVWRPLTALLSPTAVAPPVELPAKTPERSEFVLLSRSPNSRFEESDSTKETQTFTANGSGVKNQKCSIPSSRAHRTRPSSVPVHLLKSHAELLRDNTTNALMTEAIDREYDNALTELEGVRYKQWDDEDNIEDDDDDDEDEAIDIVHESMLTKPPKLRLIPDSETIYSDNLDTLKDPIAFEFEVTSSIIPEHDYPPFLPEELKTLRLQHFALTEDDWRETPEAKLLDFSEFDEGLVDHLIRLEKLKLITTDFERGRRDSVRKAYRDQKESLRQGRRVGGTGSARKNRNCNKTCLQIACTGECPTKAARPKICLLCRQLYCMGTCAKNSYTDQERTGTDGDPKIILDLLAVPPEKPKPVCNTCRGGRRAKSARAKLINGNNVVLGRPLILQATYSSGAHSAKPVDLRRSDILKPTGDPAKAMSIEMIERFEQIGVSPVVSQNSTRHKTRPSGRNTVIPGKSFASNRKESLTALTETYTASEKNKQRRPRSRASSAKIFRWPS